MQDLFDSTILLPDNVRVVVESFLDAENDYDSCLQLEAALQPLGYTFDWGLDAEPINLRKITAEEVRFKQALFDLMFFDPNGSWNEILSDHDGDYIDAYHELVLCLGQAIEDNEESRPFYKSILESLIIQ
jgi:hypothetical protein